MWDGQMSDTANPYFWIPSLTHDEVSGLCRESHSAHSVEPGCLTIRRLLGGINLIRNGERVGGMKRNGELIGGFKRNGELL